MLGFSFKPDIAALAKTLDAASRRQIPFAVAQTLTAVARKAVEAERAALSRSLDRPEPFTLRGIASLPARKDKPTAWVYIQPLQARYLAPSIIGAPQALNSNRAILKPVNVRLDRYGNIPQSWLASVRGRPDIFIGSVTFANGNKIAGVWQLPPGEHVGGRTGRGITGGRRKGWKLLVRFADPVTLSARYRWGEATGRVVRAEFRPEMRAQLAKAMKTAR